MDVQPSRLVLKYNPQNLFFAQHCQEVDTLKMYSNILCFTIKSKFVIHFSCFTMSFLMSLFYLFIILSSWQNCLSDNSLLGDDVCSERARGHDVCGEEAWVAVPRVKTVARGPALDEVGRVDQGITGAGNATSYHILRKGC